MTAVLRDGEQVLPLASIVAAQLMESRVDLRTHCFISAGAICSDNGPSSFGSVEDAHCRCAPLRPLPNAAVLIRLLELARFPNKETAALQIRCIAVCPAGEQV